MLLRARFALPVSSDAIEDAAVVVRAGVIHDVGPMARVAHAHPGERVRDLGDAILLPGFVNVHSHLELTILRGFVEDLPFLPWLRRVVDLTHDVLKPDESVFYSLLGAAEMIRAGITTVADCSATGAPFDALAIAGLRGIVFQEAFAPTTAHVEGAVARLEERLDAVEGMATPRLGIGLSPHSPYMACEAMLRRCLEVAERRGLPVSIHAAESEAEDAFIRDGKGPIADHFATRGFEVSARSMSPVAWLAHCGYLSARVPVQLVHLARARAEDLDLIGAASTASGRLGIAACPRSNARLGNGLPDLRAFTDRGLSWGLGTDGGVSAGRCDLMAEAATALVLERGRTRDVDAADARSVLARATLLAARSLGLGDAIGSLEVGKQADLCAISLEASRMVPAHEPHAVVVDRATPADVILTMVAGDVIYDGREIATLDEPRVRARCRERGEIIKASLEGRALPARKRP